MICNIVYQLIDLYFVAGIGVAAVAGITAAGSAGFIVLASAQVLGAGTVAMVAQALGRRNYDDVKLIFNQSLGLSLVCGAFISVIFMILIYPYLRLVSADEATVDAGIEFTLSVLPGFAAALPMNVLSSGLRGAGLARPATAFYIVTVVINAILAPVLVAGWGTGLSLGVRGAGLATSISVVFGAVMLALYAHRSLGYLRITWRLMLPRRLQCRRIFEVGLPVGAEITLMFLFPVVTLYAIGGFGASSQAGFSVGSRISQALLMPGMAIAFAVAPIVGQNFGAMNRDRIVVTFRTAVWLGCATMIATSVLVHAGSEQLVRVFGASRAASEIAVSFLKVTSFAFVAQGLIFISSNMFQGLGVTRPSMISSGACFAVFSVSVLWMMTQPTFRIEHVWYLIVISSSLQALLNLWMLRWALRTRLSKPAVEHAV
jgi:putative MATE family efflux protein